VNAAKILRVPEPAQRHDAVMDDGAVIQLRRHGNPAGPRLVLAHGNGFAIDGYYPFWRLLAGAYDLVLYDQRNHGRNPPHDIARHDIPQFVADMDRLLDIIPARFGAKPMVGVFHSISGVTAIRHALENGFRWAGLALFDPPLIPSRGHALHEDARAFELGLAEWAASRPDRFANIDSLAARFAGAKSLSGWVPGVHGLMARAITRDDPATGDRILSCPRAGESQIYTTNAGLDLCPRLGALTGPVMLIGSDHDHSHARAPGRVNRAMHAEHGIEWIAIPGTSHMLLVEKPGACAATLEGFLARHGLTPRRNQASTASRRTMR